MGVGGKQGVAGRHVGLESRLARQRLVADRARVGVHRPHVAAEVISPFFAKKKSCSVILTITRIFYH